MAGSYPAVPHASTYHRACISLAWMIGEKQSPATKRATSPLFSPALPTRSFVNSSYNFTYYFALPTLNQHFIQSIMAQNTHTQSFGDNNAYCGITIGSHNTTIYKSDEDAQILRWLSPLEPNNRHQGVRTDRFDGVGDWLLETREFREWRSCDGGPNKAVLFCFGNPGVGKTYPR